MTNEPKNMELMQTLDDAWNAQDWDTFDKRHKPDVLFLRCRRSHKPDRRRRVTNARQAVTR